MFDGTVKAVEDIQVDDVLMGDDSTPRTVRSLQRGCERMWRVQPNSNGHEPYVVNESHILTGLDRHTGEVVDRPLSSVLSLKRPDQCFLGMKAPVQFKPRPPPVDPYWFGLWLGDGCSADVGITTADSEVVEFLWNYAGELGMTLSVYPEKNASDTYAITRWKDDNGRSCVFNPLRDALKEMGVRRNKHLPQVFRANSEEVRLKVLAGLIDSDGHRPQSSGKENVCEFVFRSRKLADDVQWLGRSLGFRSSISRRVIKGVDYWRVMLYGELWRVPTKVVRKQYPKGKLHQNPLSYGFTLVDEGIGNYYGFSIDGNGRFLLGDCTVVHNTETVTLLLRFLIIFYGLLVGEPLMAGIASPRGEQAKTDTDRVKKSLVQLRESWQVEDREFNNYTIRAYRFDKLTAEIFTFSLAPTTNNESKTLNLLLVEEAHKTDDQKRSDQLDPMLASTGGVKWMIGVGCTHVCDFKKGCDGELAHSRAIVCDVDRVIADRRKKYEESGNPKHLEYEKAFQKLLRQVGRENPEIKRNFYLEDTIEAGNFVSRERLLSCGQPMAKPIRMERLGLGVDWARRSDNTWAFLANEFSDTVDMLKVPHVPYEQQCELINEWLKEKRKRQVLKDDGSIVEEEFTYLERIMAVRGDSTGSAGDAPMEMLARITSLPIDDDSHFVFTTQSKNTLYLNFEAALFRDPEDQLRFSYPADHPLAGEFEDQMIALEREYLKDGEYLSVHHPDTPGARDDAPDGCGLSLVAASNTQAGQIIIL